MKYTDVGYVKLIANAVGHKKYDIDFSLMSYERLVKLCTVHKTIGLVWVGMSKLDNIPQKYKTSFETGLKQEVIVYVNRNIFFEKLSKKLSENQIKHVLIKGKTVAKYYPQEELRRFGDIDLIISPKDKDNVREIVESMGGSYVFDESDKNVDFYETGKEHIEIHSKIVTGKRFSKSSKYKEFSQQLFDNSEQIEGCLYYPNFVDSMVYNVYHTAKHFYEGGCGVRMILDLWLMRNAATGKELNAVLETLDEMGLKRFALKALKLGDIWYGSSKDKDDSLQKVQQYIITSGLYGKGNIGKDVAQIRKEKNKSYVINVLKWLFPSCEKMRECSSWFEDKPAILLPVAYVIRGYTNVKERGGILKTSKKIIKGHKKNNNLNSMLKIMELK